MSPHYIVEFDTSLPDDTLDDGVDFHQGGRGVAAAVGELLQRLGCEVEGPLDEGDHGWGLRIKAQGRSLWCEVTIIDRHVLQFSANLSLTESLFGREPVAYFDTLGALSRDLAADPRFWNIRWWSYDEYERGAPGADQPIFQGRGAPAAR